MWPAFGSTCHPPWAILKWTRVQDAEPRESDPTFTWTCVWRNWEWWQLSVHTIIVPWAWHCGVLRLLLAKSCLLRSARVTLYSPEVEGTHHAIKSSVQPPSKFKANRKIFPESICVPIWWRRHVFRRYWKTSSAPSGITGLSNGVPNIPSYGDFLSASLSCTYRKKKQKHSSASLLHFSERPDWTRRAEEPSFSLHESLLRQFHLFLIGMELTCRDSNTSPHKREFIPIDYLYG